MNKTDFATVKSAATKNVEAAAIAEALDNAAFELVESYDGLSLDGQIGEYVSMLRELKKAFMSDNAQLANENCCYYEFLDNFLFHIMAHHAYQVDDKKFKDIIWILKEVRDCFA